MLTKMMGEPVYCHPHMHKAMKMRVEAKLTLSTADGLIKTISSDPDYDWADNPKNKSKFGLEDCRFSAIFKSTDQILT